MRELILNFTLYLRPVSAVPVSTHLFTIIGQYDDTQPAKIKIEEVLVNGRAHSEEIQSFLVSLIGAEAIEEKVVETLES